MIGCVNKSSQIYLDWVRAKGVDEAYAEHIRASALGESMKPVEEVYPETAYKPETDHEKFLKAMADLENNKGILELTKRFQEAMETVVKQLGTLKKSIDPDTKATLIALKKFLKEPTALGEFRTYAEFLWDSQRMLAAYKEKAFKLAEEEGVDAVAKIQQLRYYYEFSNSFNDVLKELKAALRSAGNENPVKDLVNKLISDKDSIRDEYLSQVTPLLAEVLADQNIKSNENFMKATVNELALLDKSIERNKKAGNTSVLKRLEKNRDDIRAFLETKVPTKELIESMLKGEQGDSNFMSFLFEAAIVSGDGTISSFAKFVKGVIRKVRLKVMPIQNNLAGAMETFKKATHRNAANSAEFYKGLYQTTERWHDGAKMKTVSFLDEFGGTDKQGDNFYTVIDRYNEQIRKLRDDGKVKEMETMQDVFNEWQKTYMEREYTPEYYAVYDFLTPEAKSKREFLFSKIEMLSKGTMNGTLSEGDMDTLNSLWDDYKALGYEYRPDGTKKTGEDLEVAESIQKFNNARKLIISYELTDGGRALFDRLKRNQEALFEAGKITKDELDRWIRQNTRREIDDRFFSERERIFKRLSELIEQMPKKDNEEGKASIRELWRRMFAVVLALRDEDGVPDGREASAETQKLVKDLNQEIEAIKRKFLGDDGLNREERIRYQELNARRKEFNLHLQNGGTAETGPMSQSDRDEFEQLSNRRNSAMEALQTDRMKGIRREIAKEFARLAKLQLSAPTQYYLEAFDTNLRDWITLQGEELKNLPPEMQRDLFKQSEWYKNNHYSVLEWEDGTDEVQGTTDLRTGKTYTQSRKTGGYNEVDKPTYLWDEILPRDKKYIREGEPSFKYKQRQVNDNFKNKSFKDDRYGQPKRRVTIGGVEQNSPYLNPEFERLRKEEKASFDFLKTLTDTYLEAQEGLHYKMGLLLPAIEKKFSARLREGQIDKGYFKDRVGSLSEGFRRMWSQTEQDADAGITALADFEGYEFRYVPIKYTGTLDATNVSLNLVDSVLKFVLSAEQTKSLTEVLPVAQSLLDVVHNNPVRIEKEDGLLKKMLGVSKRLKKGETSNREMQLRSMINTYFYNEYQKQEEIFGMNITKITDNLMGIGALQILAMNIPAQITNYISGYMQSIIESAGKEFYTPAQLTKGLMRYKKAYPDLLKDAYKVGRKSVLGQLFDRFDVEQGKYESHLGSKGDHSMLQGLRETPYILKNAGEHELAAAIFLAMAEARPLKIKEKGVERVMDFVDAWTTDKDGNLKLKDGVEFPEGEETMFNHQVHGVIRKTQGNYDKFNQPHMEKFWYGRLGNFMRKYIVPMVVNRYGKKRYDNELGKMHEGIYRVFWRTFLNDIGHLRLNVIENWANYTPSERAAVAKTLTEVSAVMILMLLAWMLGGYGDKEDYEQNSFLVNHMLYQLLRLKSETENFEPQPSAINEIWRTVTTPSIILTSFKGVIKTGSLMGQWAMGDDVTYKRDTGFWKEGDSKIMAGLAGLVGFKGTVGYPDQLIKNFNNAQRIR